MIYRVGDSDNPAYDYSSQLKPAKNTEGQEKFSLDRQKEQTAPEKKEEKGEDKKLHEKPGADIRKQGVRLELSGRGMQAGEMQEASARKETGTEAETGSLTSFFKGLFQTVRDFLYRLWNETPEETVISEELAEPEADFKAREAERDEKIRRQLRSGNLEQVINLLTDDGRRTMAKNSTLLTYYDKSGKLTQINASDRERILHGDRNVRKL